ncbi:MAG: DNA topoisomerase 3 [Alphaproteobacteria bacterium]|nr:DNA topoisomerase 3 [Alphaproteobacteria bacterium]
MLLKPAASWIPVSHRLVLAEKPSVARDIARVMGATRRRDGWLEGEGLRVSWCVGHLVELAEPGAYAEGWKSWRMDELPMLPDDFKLSARDSGKDQWKVVRSLLRDADCAEVINACDAGREGELIFAYAYQLAGGKAPVRRLWISSMTDAAIRAGLSDLRPGAELAPLEAAARCRSEADWLVGLNATRAMTLRMREEGGGALLSLGRVQTPVLAMLVDREQEIEDFEPQDFWQLLLTLEAEAGQWQATWTGQDAEGKDLDRLFKKEEAEALAARVAGHDGVVAEVERKRKHEKPPLLYDLTSLQREANARFGLTAKQTLDIAQRLYEVHKVLTYPRTDSRHLGSAMVPRLPDLISALRFAPYQPHAEAILARWPVKLTDRVIDDAEVSDHHAIIPTGTDPRPLGLAPMEKRVFDLVARRFLAVFFPDAVFANAKVTARVAEERFLAKGRQRLSAGWQEVDPPRSLTKQKDVILPAVDEGDAAAQIGQELKQGQTRPPRRFNEASLLGAMERAGEGLDEAELRRAMKRKGLGTPATRAAIIETLLRRRYVTRDQRELLPTPQGRALIQALPVEALRSPRMTGEWEARLSAIAEGDEDRAAFMADARAFAAEVVEALRGSAVDKVLARRLSPPEEPGERLDACPRCQGEVRAQSRGWRCAGCGLYIPSQVASRDISARMARALLRDGETPAVKGFKSRAGKRFTAALRLDEDGKVVFHFPDPESLGPCPACQQPVRRRGKVWTCDTGRECAFVVFAEMSGRETQDEDVRALLAEGRTSLLEGFSSRDDRSFSGVLEWREGRVRVREVDPRAFKTVDVPCRRCGAVLRFEDGRWRCAGACGLSLPGEVASRPLRAEEVSALMREGQTGRLYGFRQSSGALFQGWLRLDDNGRVQLEFGGGEPARPIPPGGPPPAFGERVDCPRCVQSGSLDPGYVIAGRSAWGCSRWREGCTMALPFEHLGVRITDDEAQRFFGKAKATRYLKGFVGPEAAGRACRLVFDPEAARGWSFEPRRR